MWPRRGRIPWLDLYSRRWLRAAWCSLSATEPHREVITPGKSGLLVEERDPMVSPGRRFDVLADPAAFWPLGDAASAARARALLTGSLPAPARAGIRIAGSREGRVVVNVLFIHDAFPAQFGQLALELARNRGWKCRFLVQSLSSCPTPTPEMLKAVELHLVPKSAEHRTSEGIPWPQIFGHYLDQCQTIHDTVKAMPHLRPDLVVAHGGRGAPSLFLREVVDCPIVIYCEYYFARAIATFRTGSICRRPSPHRSFPVRSTPPPSRPWSTATQATRPPTGKNSRFLPSFIPRSKSTSTASIRRSTAGPAPGKSPGGPFPRARGW